MPKDKPTRKQLAQAGIMMPAGYDEVTTPAQRLKSVLGPEHGGDADPKKKSAKSTTTKSKTKKAEPTEDAAGEGPTDDAADDGPDDDSAAELEPWPLQSTPVEYLDTYGKNKPRSKLAQAYIDAGKGDVTAKK